MENALIDLAMTVVTFWINAVLVLAAVWQLAAGKTWSGNWITLGAAASGFVMGIMIGWSDMYPYIAMNAILYFRGMWMLRREWDEVRKYKGGEHG